MFHTTDACDKSWALFKKVCYNNGAFLVGKNGVLQYNLNFCSLTTFGKLKYLLGLQTHICIFVRSHRQETFFKNVNVLEELATLSFALDYVN